MILLEAQAAPSATLLPCIKLKPAGWSISDVFIHNGRARFTLDSEDAVRTHVQEDTGGRATLDPPTEASG